MINRIDRFYLVVGVLTLVLLVLVVVTVQTVMTSMSSLTSTNDELVNEVGINQQQMQKAVQTLNTQITIPLDL